MIPRPYAPSSYAPPAARLSEASGRRSELHDLADKQQRLLSLMLFSLLFPIAFVVFRMGGNWLGNSALAGLICTLAAYRLAVRLYPARAAVPLALLAAVPVLGVLPMLAIHGRATRRLRAAGIPVGWLGARLRDVDTATAR